MNPARQPHGRMLATFLLAGLLSAILAGCAADRLDSANRMATDAGLSPQAIPTAHYTIATWSRIIDRRAPVSVYIEGDGEVYTASGDPTGDPTPRKALGLYLATLDPSPNVVYIARACQFIHSDCQPDDWTTRRFSEPMIVAVDQAIGHLVRPDQAINLVGYSGGAALAVVIAARRHGVISLRTVAGNLDPVGVNRLHGASENLVVPDILATARRLPPLLSQVHYVGRTDKIVPPMIAETYAKAVGHQACLRIRSVDANHKDGWVEAWPKLVGNSFGCIAPSNPMVEDK